MQPFSHSCQTSAKTAADDYALAELWQTLPKMILLLPNFGEVSRR
jgi:hypothetical protein